MNLTDLYAIRHGAVQPTEHPLSRKDERPSIVDRGEGVQLSLPVHSAEIGCVDWYIYPDPAPKGHGTPRECRDVASARGEARQHVSTP